MIKKQVTRIKFVVITSETEFEKRLQSIILLLIVILLEVGS